MSAKYLNLDSLATPRIILKIDGVEHVMKPLSVGDFVENVKFSETVSKDDMAAQIDAMARIVGQTFPTLGEDGARKLNFPQIEKIMEWIRSVDLADVSEGEGDSEGNGTAAA